jgi:peptidoglycan/LPS O-acetylase OafA/YrhL
MPGRGGARYTGPRSARRLAFPQVVWHVGACMAIPVLESESAVGAPAGAVAVSSGQRFYRRELDGLRFVAFLVVFWHHALPQVVSGWQGYGLSEGVASWLAAATISGGHGVDLFFALSSYLITELLLREQEQFGVLSPGKFLVRRALRIWPLYFAFLFLCSGIVPGFRFKLTHSELLAFVLMVGNWHVVWFGFPTAVAAPLWSISVEEQFYLAWPWLLRRGGRRRLLVVCAAMIAIALGVRTFLALRATPHPGVWCNTFARLDAIALGALVAAWDRARPLALAPAPRAALLVLAPLVVVAVTHFVPVSLPNASVHHIWSYLVIDLAAAALLVASLRPAGSPRGVLGSSAFVYLGRISYGLYVFHALGLKLAGSAVVRVLGPTPIVLRSLVGLGLTIALASLSYYALERPFLKLKAKFARVASRPD